MTSARSTREARQAKAAAMRAQVAKAEARRRQWIVGGTALAVILVVLAGFLIVQNARRDTAVASASTPGNLGPDNSFTVGQASAPVTLVAYEDFLCPACNQFEQANTAQIKAWVDAGTVKVDYRPVAILDRSSTDNYSTRSLNAAAAVLNSTPSAFPAFHQALFANQPAEGGAGLTDQKLIDLAVAAGAPKAAITSAVEGQTYKAWTVRATEAASQAGLSGTPRILVNGTEIKSPDAATLKAAVEAAVTAAKK
jgi:protein-disulfide isomerase